MPLGKVNSNSISTTVMSKSMELLNQNQPRLIQFLIYDHDPHEGEILLRIKAIYLKRTNLGGLYSYFPSTCCPGRYHEGFIVFFSPQFLK